GNLSFYCHFKQFVNAVVWDSDGHTIGRILEGLNSGDLISAKQPKESVGVLEVSPVLLQSLNIGIGVGSFDLFLRKGGFIKQKWFLFLCTVFLDDFMIRVQVRFFSRINLVDGFAFMREKLKGIQIVHFWSTYYYSHTIFPGIHKQTEIDIWIDGHTHISMTTRK